MVGIGIDIGTTSTCTVAVDAESGQVKASLSAKTPQFLASPNPWERAQPPEEILDQVRELLGQMTERLQGIGAIGVTGQMHGIVYLGRDGRSLSPLYTWQDGRGDVAKDGETYAEQLSRKTGYALATGFGSVTHEYNVQNGLVPEGAVSLCTIADYIAMALAGRKEPVMHSSNAAGLGCFDLEQGCFGVENRLLPRVEREAMVLGYAEGDIPVSIALGDNQASFIGAVQEDATSVLLNVGTGGQVSYTAPLVKIGGSIELRPLTADRFLLAGNSLCGGRAYAMLEEFFRSVLHMIEAPTEERLYAAMERLAAQPEEAEPLAFDTRFAGTRSDPSLRGSITGIGVDNFTPAAFVRGTIRGIAGELYGLYQEMRALAGKKPAHLIGAGNGIRKNRLLRRALEQQFGMTMEIPLHTEEAAYGAALFGMTGAGIFQSIDQARALIRYEEKGAACVSEKEPLR